MTGSAGRVFAGLLAAVLGLGWLGALRFGQWAHEPRPVPGVRIDVPPGASARRVARDLARAGLFPGPWAALATFYAWSDPARIHAGTYRFAGALRPVDVVAALTQGRVEQVEVTLPEGLTAREMAPILERAGVTGADAFTALAYSPESPRRWDLPGPSLEGFLFPDTYRFARGQPPERVVDAMIRRFREVALPLLPEARRRGLDLLSWVTLASLVEKEASRDDERPLVAAVFLNRLERGMRLESDPTVIYGLRDFDGNLTRAHLRTDHPYNTYTRRGLPPGPIASPGLASLRAAAYPADVDYLYFVSRNDGTHVFSRTYAEHRRWVRRFQRGGRR